MADFQRFVAELHVHSLVEHVERAFPQALVLEGFAVADDAAVHLVDLFEAAVDHEGAEDLAADAAGAVGDDGLVLEVVVLARVEFLDEVVGGVDVGHDGVLEFADLGFKGVAAVKEHHFLAAGFLGGNEFVQLLRLEVGAAAHHAVLIDLQFSGGAEADDFLAGLHAQAGEVVAGAVGPFDVHVLEAGVLTCGLQILFEVLDVTANRGVDAVLGDDDAPLEAQLLAQGTLPQLDRFRITQGVKP